MFEMFIPVHNTINVGKVIYKRRAGSENGMHANSTDLRGSLPNF
jgi:hypothetical protein